MAITILNNGPILIDNDQTVLIKDGEGNNFNLSDKLKVALCRCGHSENKPFCDGKHKGTFASEVKAPEWPNS